MVINHHISKGHWKIVEIYGRDSSINLGRQISRERDVRSGRDIEKNTHRDIEKEVQRVRGTG